VAYLFQSLIIFAVVASNIHWQWTPNGYLAAGLGIALAYVLARLALVINGWFQR
jgi:ABC-type transport system involved in cytochrome c biogenesis permease subunit